MLYKSFLAKETKTFKTYTFEKKQENCTKLLCILTYVYFAFIFFMDINNSLYTELLHIIVLHQDLSWQTPPPPLANYFQLVKWFWEYS